jgi:hypothetical protein
MRKVLAQAAFAATFTLFAVGGSSFASAAGWSGGDSSPIRASFSQGLTLTKVWTRINDR